MRRLCRTIVLATWVLLAACVMIACTSSSTGIVSEKGDEVEGESVADHIPQFSWTLPERPRTDLAEILGQLAEIEQDPATRRRLIREAAAADPSRRWTALTFVDNELDEIFSIGPGGPRIGLSFCESCAPVEVTENDGELQLSGAELARVGEGHISRCRPVEVWIDGTWADHFWPRCWNIEDGPCGEGGPLGVDFDGDGNADECMAIPEECSIERPLLIETSVGSEECAEGDYYCPLSRPVVGSSAGEDPQCYPFQPACAFVDTPFESADGSCTSTPPNDLDGVFAVLDETPDVEILPADPEEE